MTAELLKDIVDIPGVTGVLVASNHGKVIEKIGLDIKEIILETIAIHILRIISAYHIKKRIVQEIELIWDDYHVIVKNSTQFVVITFCNSKKALSLLRMTINVVMAHLLEDKKFMKQIKKHASEKTLVLRRGNLEPEEINLISKLQ